MKSTFRIFFFCSGAGKGESEALGGGGGRFFIENPGGGGLPGRSGQGGEGPGGCLREICGGGGSIFFFSGPKFPPSFLEEYAVCFAVTCALLVLKPKPSKV